jgi:hypothetical protein
MADQIVIEYSANIDKLQTELREAEKDQLALAKGAKVTSDTITKESNKAATSVNKVQKSTVSLKDSFNTLSQNLPFAGAAQQAQQLSSTLLDVGKSAKSVSGAMNILKVAIAATGIGLLITALASLYAYFTKTEKGSEALERGLATVGAAVDAVIGRFARLGEGVVQFFSGDFAQAADTFKNSFAGIGEEISNATKEAMDFTAALQDIEDQERLLSVEVAKSINERQRLVIASRNGKIAIEEAEEALKKADAIERDIVAKQIALQEKKVKALVRENQLKIQTGELAKDNKTDQLIEAEIKLENLRGNSLETLEKIQNREDALRENRIADAEKDFQDRLKKIDLQEKLAVGFAKVEERTEGEIIAIQQGANQKRLELFKKANKDKTDEYGFLILQQKELEKEYTAFLAKEEQARLAEEKRIFDLKEKERKEWDDYNKSLDDAETDRIAADQQKRMDAYMENLKKQEDEEKASMERRRQNIVAGLGVISNALQGIADLRLSNELMAIDEERKANEERVNNQLSSLEKRNSAGLLSEREYAAQKARIEKESAKKESDLKRKQFEADKQASLTKVAIEGAVAVAKALAAAPPPINIPLIAFQVAQTAVQLALIQSQPTPKFKDGIIDLQGEGTGTSDSIHAMLSKGESVMTASETKKYKPLLSSIRKGEFEKYSEMNIVRPAIKRERERWIKEEQRNNNIEAYIKSLNGSFDVSHLERLTKKNKSVRLENTNDIVEGIVNGIHQRRRRGL